jgi:hypothetical protein
MVRYLLVSLQEIAHFLTLIKITKELLCCEYGRFYFGSHPTFKKSFCIRV